ncbi:MAG: hypothetical protein O3C27_08160 [Actinomycetota bacterium]|nr:hypothetical protein [Actinomycetota bacterium]
MDVNFRSDLVRVPNRPEDLDLPIGMVEELFMRRVLTDRQTNIHDVSDQLGVTMPIGRVVADSLRDKKLLEFHGLEGRAYRIGLTEHGHKVTSERMIGNSYASFLPVSLSEYTRVTMAQKSEVILNRDTIRSAFGDLVVADELLDQPGPAFLSDGAIFLYGPPGTGKTSLAERMIRLHSDRVLIPRAVSVDGSVIVVYDPATHKPVDHNPKASTVDGSSATDPSSSWVVNSRPRCSTSSTTPSPAPTPLRSRCSPTTAFSSSTIWVVRSSDPMNS